MTLKSWLVALTLAGFAVAGGSYVYNKGAIETDLQSENLGISEQDMNIDLEDVNTFMDGIKNVAGRLRDGISNIIDEYIDKN